MSGSIADNAGRGSGVIAAAGGGGKVIWADQAVVTVNTASSTSSTWTAIAGLSVTTNTLAETTSRLLIQWMVNAAGTTVGHSIRIMRDATPICINTGSTNHRECTSSVYRGSQAGTMVCRSGSYIDTPGATTAVTYTIQWVVGNAGGTMYLNRSSDHGASTNSPVGASTLLVTELAAN